MSDLVLMLSFIYDYTSFSPSDVVQSYSDNQSYDVLKNSRDEYLATDSSLVELWNQIESEKEEEKKAKEQSNSYPYMKFYTNPQNSDISEGNNIDFNWGNINKNNVNNNFEDIMKKYNSVEYKEKGEK